MNTHNIAARLSEIELRIASSVQQFGRERGSVQLLAVSKTKPISAIREAAACGQRHFGENYLQEALEKIEALGDDALVWHFIGPIQANKTAAIARHFSWVHTIDRLKIAQRLNDQRPASLPSLNVCLQVNSSDEASKSGITLEELPELATAVSRLPQLRLRGLMTIPAPEHNFENQRRPFCKVREALEQLNSDGYALDTLSMGMSNDMEAAIAEGATLVRIGSALFGRRDQRAPLTTHE